MAAPFRSQYTQEEIDNALAMLIAYAGNAEAAEREMKERAKDGGPKHPCAETLKKWAQVTHWER